MSIFIRDTLSTSGTTPGDEHSADINPDFLSGSLIIRDTLNTSGDTPGDGTSADINPDFLSGSVGNQQPP